MNKLSLTNRIGTDLLRFVDRKGLFGLFFILFDMVFQNTYLYILWYHLDKNSTSEVASEGSQ